MNYKIKQYLKRIYKDATFLSMRNTLKASEFLSWREVGRAGL